MSPKTPKPAKTPAPTSTKTPINPPGNAARDQILAGIRSALKRGPLDAAARRGLQQRLDARSRNLVPARTAGLDRAGLVALFRAKAEAVSATVDQIADMASAPKAVAAWLASENLSARLVQAPGLDSKLDWRQAPTVAVRSGPANPDDDVSLTPAFAAVAETGTLVLHSGPDTPTTLNFAPPNHIVLLAESAIVGAYEDAWDRLRPRGEAGHEKGHEKAGAEAGHELLPRTVNFITGPSRTGDIEQQIELGVHGPLRLHIILVEDGA